MMMACSEVAQNIYSASNQLFSNPWIPPCDVFSPVNTNQQTLSVLLRSLTYVSIYIFESDFCGIVSCV